MFNSDSPVGGIWAVRPVGQDGNPQKRQKEAGSHEGKAQKRRPGDDKVTLSVEAKRLSREVDGEPAVLTENLPQAGTEES